jgi:EmrB/QacA subfamily drug resistance transporter
VPGHDAAEAFFMTRGTFVVAAAVLGSGMALLDATAVNVILPLIQRDLHSDAQFVQWVVEGYGLFLSALILVGGALGDIYGRRRMFVAGVALFAAASVACALAHSMEQLVAARCIQGIGAALLVPESLALISAEFEPRTRGKAIGTWAAFSAISGAVGPVLGGAIAQSLSWRWVFALNVPVAAIVIFLTLRCVRESRDESAGKHIDIAGALLATSGLGALTFSLIQLQAGLGDKAALAIGIAAPVLLAFFIAYEARARAPMMPLRFFRSRDFSAANAYTFLLYAGLGGSLFFVPFDLINVQHYSPLQAGGAMLPMTTIIFLFSRYSGAAQSRFGASAMLTVGALVACAGFTLFGLAGEGRSYWLSFFPASVVLGIGAAIFVAPLTATVMNSLETAHAGVASGVNNAIARVAALIAVAALGLVLSTVFYRSYDARVARLALVPASRLSLERDRSRLLTGYVPSGLASVDRPRVRVAVDGSFLGGFGWVMGVSAALAFAAAVIAKFSFSRAGRADPA